MDAADLFRSAGLHRHLDHGKRRRVRREDRAGLTDPVELAEEVLLDREIFDDRFEDEIAVGELTEIGDRADAAEQGVALRGVEATLVDLAGE